MQGFFGSEEGKPQGGKSTSSVARILPDGDRWLVADRLGNGEFARDPPPPLNQGFTHLVTVYALSGAATAIGLDAMLVLPGTFAVNAGADASRCALTRRATSLSRSSKLEGTLFTFADGGRKRWSAGVLSLGKQDGLRCCNGCMRPVAARCPHVCGAIPTRLLDTRPAR